MFTLALAFTTHKGLSKKTLKLNIKYILTTLNSFYLNGNNAKSIVFTNNRWISSFVEEYAHKSNNPVVVEHEDFSSILTKGGIKLKNASRQQIHLAQTLAMHLYFKDEPFLFADGDIMFTNELPELPTNKVIRFWGKTWQQPVRFNTKNDDYSFFENRFSINLNDTDKTWLNNGIYFSNVDLTKIINPIIEDLFTIDISSFLANKPYEEIFHNLVRWMYPELIEIDNNSLMNIVPNRVETIFNSIALKINEPRKPINIDNIKSLHFIKGNSPEQLHSSRAIDNLESDLAQDSTEYSNWVMATMNWYHQLAIVDELLGYNVGGEYKVEEIKPIINKYLKLM